MTLPLFSQTSNPDTSAVRSSSPIDYEAVRLSKVVTAVRINEKITLDGRLDEPAWKRALPATDFVEQRPHPGELATEQTEARFLFDDDNLYIGINCFDSNAAHAVVNELKEDFSYGDSDSIAVYIDGLRDRRGGFAFYTNPAGAKRDTQLFDDSRFNQDWDGVWDVKVTRNDDGWIAEFVIPFKTLRFSESPSQEWALNLGRRTMRVNEDSNWAPIPIRFNAARMTLAGTLKGLENIHQGRNLKVKPFVTAGFTQSRNADGQLETIQSLGRLKDYDGGVDVKYSVTPALTLDATYHTDFAQVEVDQQQVNLTRFNLFFPEKRDFFLENSGIFGFGSAGTSGNLVPFFSRRIGLSATGTPVPIVGGARLSGKVSRYDVGLLAMKTDSLGTTPSNNFLVARIRRNLLRNSWIGTLVTSRDSTLAGDYNRVYGTDAHFQFYNKLEFDSYILQSKTPGKSGQDQARRFESAWKDDEFVISGEYNSVQPNFNPEVGFVRRTSVTQYFGDIAWKPLLRNSDVVRNLNFETTLDYNEGSGSGKLETRTHNVNLGILFENNGSVNFTMEHTFDRLLNPLNIPSRNPQVSIAIGGYDYRRYTASVSTNPSMKYSGSGSFGWGDFYNGQRKSLSGTLNVRPNYHLALNLTYDRNQVTLPNGAFTTNLLGTRFVYAFTPRAFVNAFLQYNADTHQVSTNIRFNWTHHPLSDLYVVYNDTRDTITGQTQERSLIVKLTNLFNF